MGGTLIALERELSLFVEKPGAGQNIESLQDPGDQLPVAVTTVHG